MRMGGGKAFSQWNALRAGDFGSHRQTPDTTLRYLDKSISSYVIAEPITFTGAFEFEVEFTNDANVDNASIASFSNSSTWEFLELQVEKPATESYIKLGSNGRTPGNGGLLPVGPLVRCGVEWTGTELICYVNGVEDYRVTPTTSAWLNQAFDTVRFGRNHDWTLGWDGYLKAIRIWEGGNRTTGTLTRQYTKFGREDTVVQNDVTPPGPELWTGEPFEGYINVDTTVEPLAESPDTTWTTDWIPVEGNQWYSVGIIGNRGRWQWKTAGGVISYGGTTMSARLKMPATAAYVRCYYALNYPNASFSLRRSYGNGQILNPAVGSLHTYKLNKFTFPWQYENESWPNGWNYSEDMDAAPYTLDATTGVISTDVPEGVSGNSVILTHTTTSGKLYGNVYYSSAEKGVPVTFQCRVKSVVGSGYFRLLVTDNAAGPVNHCNLWVRMISGKVTDTASNGTAVLLGATGEMQPDGWVLVTLTMVIPGNTQYGFWAYMVDSSGSTVRSLTTQMAVTAIQFEDGAVASPYRKTTGLRGQRIKLSEGSVAAQEFDDVVGTYGTITPLTMSGDGEVEVIFATNTTGVQQMLLSGNSANTYIAISSTGSLVLRLGGTYNNFVPSASVMDGKVHTLRALKSGSTTICYLDGVQVEGAKANAGSSDIFEFLCRYTTATQFLSGLILGVKIWTGGTKSTGWLSRWYKNFTHADGVLFNEAAPMDKNLVVNGNFTQGLTGWAEGGGTGHSAVVQGELELTATALWAEHQAQTITVETGKSYVITLKHRRGTASLSKVQLTGAVGSAVTFDNNTTTHKVIHHEFVATTTSVTITAYGTAGTSYISDVQLVKHQGSGMLYNRPAGGVQTLTLENGGANFIAGNVVANGQFLDGSAMWTNYQSTLSSENNILKITSTTTGFTSAYQTISGLMANGSYRVNALGTMDRLRVYDTPAAGGLLYNITSMPAEITAPADGNIALHLVAKLSGGVAGDSVEVYAVTMNQLISISGDIL